MNDKTIGFIGAGQMARAFASGLMNSESVEFESITASDPSELARDQFRQFVPGTKTTNENAELVQQSDIIVLAVKPQRLPDVFTELDGQWPADRLVVSVVAGASTEQISQHIGHQRVIRVMPNTPCLIGQGVCAVARNRSAETADHELVDQLMSATATVVHVDEAMLDAVTGLSGSGPAYVFTFIESLSDAGVNMGLTRDVANTLALETVIGSAMLLKRSREHPALMRERVASPGGTTIAGMEAMEQNGFRASVYAAVKSATERSRELRRVVDE